MNTVRFATLPTQESRERLFLPVQEIATTVRRASLKDAHSIAQIQVASWRWAFSGILPSAFLKSMRVKDKAAMWKRAIETEQLRVWLIEKDGVCLGFAAAGESLNAEDNSLLTAEIYSIFMRPSSAGHGYGRQLLQTMLDDLASAYFHDCVLWVMTQNHAARRFYEANGFTDNNKSRDTVFEGQPSQTMQYRVNLPATFLPESRI